MKAIVLRAHGPPEQLELATVDTPGPAAGQMRVRIVAISVDPVDTRIRSGLPIGPALPVIRCCDFSGVVDALSSGAVGFSVGDQVYGCAGGVGHIAV